MDFQQYVTLQPRVIQKGSSVPDIYDINVAHGWLGDFKIHAVPPLRLSTSHLSEGGSIMAWAENACSFHDLRGAVYLRYTPCQNCEFMLVKAKSQQCSLQGGTFAAWGRSTYICAMYAQIFICCSLYQGCIVQEVVPRNCGSRKLFAYNNRQCPSSACHLVDVMALS